jgi:hypothetical protein
MARIAAYRLAQIMIQHLIKPGSSATFRTECAWKAIRMLRYAILFPTADLAIQNRWRALCCFQLMRVYSIAGATQLTWGSNKRSMEFFAKGLGYADPVMVDGIVRQKILVLQDALILRKACVQANVNSNARWRTSPMFREAFFHALAKTINVPLLATCWSDADEAVFPRMTEFFEG